MLRGFVLPGQRRLHMKNESDSRKRSIATAIAVSGIKRSPSATVVRPDLGLTSRN